MLTVVHAILPAQTVLVRQHLLLPRVLACQA
jgi:hypothetical protein